VSVALGVQHTQGIRFIHIFGLSGYTTPVGCPAVPHLWAVRLCHIFPNYPINGTIKKNIEHKIFIVISFYKFV
jgi:hypothetical protein